MLMVQDQPQNAAWTETPASSARAGRGSKGAFVCQLLLK